jgi:flagellar biosynthesis protein FliR
VSGLTLSLGETTLAAYLLAVARVAGFVLVAPPFNSRSLPAQVRAIVALAIGLPLSAWTARDAPALTSGELALDAILQIMVGLTLGFLVLLAVSALQSAGDLLDVVGGFSLSLALDPLQLIQTSIMGRLHQLVAVTLLFASDGHLMVMQGLARSVQLMPQPRLSWTSVASMIANDVSGMFLSALQVVAPLVAVTLIADVALGLLTRAAPALNAFALGFPLKILLTLLLAGLVVTQLPGVLDAMVSQVAAAMVQMSGGG